MSAAHGYAAIIMLYDEEAAEHGDRNGVNVGYSEQTICILEASLAKQISIRVTI